MTQRSQVSDVFAAVEQLRERAGEKPIALFPVCHTVLRDWALCLGEISHAATDFEFESFWHTKNGPTFAIWNKGEFTAREVQEIAGAFSVN